MNVLMGKAVNVQLEEFSRVSYSPLAEVFRGIAPREARHAELGVEGLQEITATEDGRAHVGASVAYWRPRVAASFGGAEFPRVSNSSRASVSVTRRTSNCWRNGTRASTSSCVRRSSGRKTAAMGGAWRSGPREAARRGQRRRDLISLNI